MEKAILNGTGGERNKLHLRGQGEWEQISQSISFWQEVTFSLAGALPIKGSNFEGIYVVPDTMCIICLMTLIQQQQSDVGAFIPILEVRRLRLREAILACQGLTAS